MPIVIFSPVSNFGDQSLCQQDDTCVNLSKRKYVTILFFAPSTVSPGHPEDEVHPIIQIIFSDCLRMSTTTQCIVVEEFKP